MEKFSSPTYLGRYNVVDSLLRTLAHDTLTMKNVNEEDFTQEATSLAAGVADVLLGNDPDFPSTEWNSPGHIDRYIARIEGVDNEDPLKRITGGLLNMLRKLLEVAIAVEDETLLPEQWQWQSSAILQEYVMKMMGLPTAGYQQEQQASSAPLPKPSRPSAPKRNNNISKLRPSRIQRNLP